MRAGLEDRQEPQNLPVASYFPQKLFFGRRECRTFAAFLSVCNIVNEQVLVIAVDFDGTIVENRYPDIGRERTFAIDTLRRLVAERHKVILWTVREGQSLDDAVQFCRDRGLEFYAINRDYPEELAENNRHFSRKLKVDVFIDDRNLGGIPDWGTIYEMINNKLTYQDLLDRYADGPKQPERPRGFFARLKGR